MSHRKTAPEQGVVNNIKSYHWYLGALLLLALFICFKFFVPPFESGTPFLETLIQSRSPFIFVPALLILIPTPALVIRFFQNKKQRQNQTLIESIRDLDWPDITRLISRAHEARGFRVIEDKTTGPDSHFDMMLMKNFDKYFVLCRHWACESLDTDLVKQMYSAVDFADAHRIIIITSGSFTHEAKAFASDKPVDLIEAHNFVKLVKDHFWKDKVISPHEHKNTSYRV